MVLTQADTNFPMAHPSKRDLEDYMSRWLNVRRISGKFVRERFGMIPMTDFVEPASYERILFVGASATRQIPNTGFGIQPCIEEGELAGKVIAEALAKGDLSQASLRSFDYAWLRRNEFRASIDLFQQDFHFAYTCDEYFHEFSACCTSVPPHVVKERLLDDVDAHHLHVLAGMFLKNTQLLDRNRFHDEWIAPLSRDMGRMVYVLLAQCWSVDGQASAARGARGDAELPLPPTLSCSSAASGRCRSSCPAHGHHASCQAARPTHQALIHFLSMRPAMRRPHSGKISAGLGSSAGKSWTPSASARSRARLPRCAAKLGLQNLPRLATAAPRVP